jgi:hypothetical protein
MRRRRMTERYALVEPGEGEGRSIRCWCLVVAMVGDFVVQGCRSGMISLTMMHLMSGHLPGVKRRLALIAAIIVVSSAFDTITESVDICYQDGTETDGLTP